LCFFSFPSAAQTDDELRTLSQQGNIAQIEQYARAGNARAQGLFAIMLAERRRVAEAEEWKRRAAENGDAFTIQTFAGEALAKSDLEAAVKWYRRGAEVGDPNAQLSYAWSLRHGKGVSRDVVESFKWYLASAKGQHRGAYVALAEMYAVGEGTERDLVEALANIEIAVRVWPRHTFVHASGYEEVRKLKAKLVEQASITQISEAMRRARDLRPDLKL